MSNLFNLCLDAHGGAERWKKVREIRITGRMGGLGLLKSDYSDTPVRTAILRPREIYVEVQDFPREGSGHRAIFQGNQVSIVDQSGRVLATRKSPRRYFTTFPWNIRRWFWLDDLDVAYFMGYSIFNYFSTPFLFLRSGVKVKEIEYKYKMKVKFRRLQVTFPSEFDTHSPTQTFTINPRGLITSIHYTVDVVGKWARCTHFCRNYRNFSDFMCATRRRVFLTKDKYFRAFRIRYNLATLMWGELSKVEYVLDEPTAGADSGPQQKVITHKLGNAGSEAAVAPQ